MPEKGEDGEKSIEAEISSMSSCVSNIMERPFWNGLGLVVVAVVVAVLLVVLRLLWSF